MRIRAISKSSYVRPVHEERRATKGSLLETSGEPGERCPVRSFYETPTQWLAAHDGRDLFPVSRWAPNRTDRNLNLQFATASFLNNGFGRPLPEQIHLEFMDCTLHSQK